MKEEQDYPTIERQASDLKAAGWRPVRWDHGTRKWVDSEYAGATVWKSPAGDLFRGPHGAWKALQVIKAIEAGARTIRVPAPDAKSWRGWYGKGV